MEVLVADKKGFCFGVKHAISLAEKLLAEGKKVYCLGDLIHNKQVVNRLSQAGLEVVENLDEITTLWNGTGNKQVQIPTVLIRSHGCRPELAEEVKSRGLQLVDATCILVKHAQKIVSELYQQGYQVIIVGDPNHPEVEGLIGYAPDVLVVESEEDLKKIPKSNKLAVISQTTHSAEDFGRIVGLIAMGGYEEMKVVNTICRETARRQDSAISLCQQVQVMFVLGSRHSANTRELANLCQRNGVETHHLQNWQEFSPEFVQGKTRAGVTAGASTPDWIIEEFVENLRAL